MATSNQALISKKASAQPDGWLLKMSVDKEDNSQIFQTKIIRMKIISQDCR